MRDPYEVLGVRPDATDDEVKAAYRSLVKKYHPDRYANSPLQAQAQEKLKEINLAYDAIVRKKDDRSNPFNGGRNDWAGQGGWSNTEWSATGGSAQFADIRAMITQGLIAQAEAALERMSERPAEWHYLRGIVYLRRGWHAQAQSCFDRAASMDPGNAEYAAAAQRMQGAFRGARQWNMGGQPLSNNACRGLCASLCCLSMCCSNGSGCFPFLCC